MADGTTAIKARVRELTHGDKRERAERILVLLEHYQDVLDGLQDGARPSDDRVLALMCEAWNSPAYQQLEALREELAARFPEAYFQLAEVYFRAGRKRVAKCPRCAREFMVKPVVTADEWYGICKHGGDNVKLRPAIVRVIAARVDVTLVSFGVLWIESQWQGGVFVPEDLLAIEGRRPAKRKRVAA